MGGEIKTGCILIFKEDVFTGFEKPIFSHKEIHKVEVISKWYNEKYRQFQYRFKVIVSSCREEGEYFSKIHKNVCKEYKVVDYQIIGDKIEMRKPNKNKDHSIENAMIQAETKIMRSFWAKRSK